MIWLLAGTALAVEAELGGDVKTFVLGSFPLEHDVTMVDGAIETRRLDPYGQGVADGRLKLKLSGDHWSFEAHHAVSAVTTGASISALGTGVALEAPEAVDLTWANEGNGLRVQGRTDRLELGLSIPHLDLTLGRQPISFGSGLFFTPMDLVNPFSPATIDSEYKPGVDALRLDGFWGMSGTATLVAAYAGDWDLRGSVLAAYGQQTVGVSDLGLFLGEVHGDEVAGLSVMSSIRAVSVHGDVTGTLPDSEDEDPFVRAVVGAGAMPLGGTSVSAELYYQSLGTDEVDAYMDLWTSQRFARGELWAAGRTYGGLSVSQEITPLVHGSLSAIANLSDGSGMLLPGVSWSAAENAAVSAGAFVGWGARPYYYDLDLGPGVEPLELFVVNSELGLLPPTAYVRMASYF